MSVIIAVIIGLFYAGQSSAVFYTSQTCSSWDFKYDTCNVNLAPNTDIVHVTVDKKLSKSDCEFGRSYGFNTSAIWVHHGCRAEFNIYSCKNYRTLNCNSNDFKFATCNVASDPVNFVVLKNQKSKSECVLNTSYGQSGTDIFVRKGCRGEFLACYSTCATPTK